jgi:hypothetical protein
MTLVCFRSNRGQRLLLNWSMRLATRAAACASVPCLTRPHALMLSKERPTAHGEPHLGTGLAPVRVAAAASPPTYLLATSGADAVLRLKNRTPRHCSAPRHFLFHFSFFWPPNPGRAPPALPHCTGGGPLPCGAKRRPTFFGYFLVVLLSKSRTRYCARHAHCGCPPAVPGHVGRRPGSNDRERAPATNFPVPTLHIPSKN